MTQQQVTWSEDWTPLFHHWKKRGYATIGERRAQTRCQDKQTQKLDRRETGREMLDQPSM